MIDVAAAGGALSHAAIVQQCEVLFDSVFGGSGAVQRSPAHGLVASARTPSDATSTALPATDK